MAKKRIVVVEDESVVALDIKKNLESLGYQVAGIVATGEGAIDEAAKTNPDLVLMDIRLKGNMDGIAAAELIRAQNDIPVIYLTAYADQDTIKRAKLTEPFGYVLKPLDTRELHSTIEMALYKHDVEAILKARERWLAITLKSIGDAVIATDASGKIEFMNPVAEALTGWKSEEALGQNLRNVFNIVISPKKSGALNLATESLPDEYANTSLNHHTLVTKLGTKIPIGCNVSPIKNESGKMIGVVLVFRDMSERVKAEDALRKSEERYRLFFEEDLTGDYIARPDGSLVSCNAAFAHIFGFDSVAEANQYNLNSLFPDDNSRELFWDLLLKKKKLEYYESELRRKDGKAVFVIGNTSISHNDKNELVEIKGYLFDITERKLLQEQLNHAQKMESIGTLAGGIAHDFNNILGAILGYASFMKMKITEEHPFFNYISIVERSAVRASELTGQLLAFARGGKYDTAPVNVNEIVNETVKMIRSTFDKLIEVETHCYPNLPTVEADGGQLQQVVMNLGVNARDAMPNGGKLIVETNLTTLDEDYLKTHVEAKAGTYVTLSITDTGIGMDKETIQKIFEPFFSTKEKGKGTGLGLSVVYGVIKNHGGFVRVYSTPGQGATFIVYLPVSGKPQVETSELAEAPPRGTELLLVVDDEEEIISVLKEILESHGYKVFTALNGEEGIKIYKAHRNEISLVILDMIMPKMGGRETFARLKRINPKIKALLSSGYSRHGKVEEILHEGVKGFVQKPFRASELLSVIRKTID
jgi:two-component system cell cycle sensor histidine kinase/response regulator CckA